MYLMLCESEGWYNNIFLLMLESYGMVVFG